MTSDIERFEFDELAVRELVALREEMSLLTKNGIPSFTTPERAAKVLAAMVGYTNHLNRG